MLVNPNVLNNPRWDMCKVAAWGPFSNLLLAILFALPLRFGLLGPGDQGVAQLLLTCMIVNLSLMLFNLIPVGPLDGAKVLVAFLPDRMAYEFSRFMAQWGGMILLALIFVGRPLLHILIGVPLNALLRLLLGI